MGVGGGGGADTTLALSFAVKGLGDLEGSLIDQCNYLRKHKSQTNTEMKQ